MKLSRKWIDKLVRLPESGMGYQIVDITLKNGDVIKNITVFNCEEVSGNSIPFSEKDIKDITLHQ